MPILLSRQHSTASLAAIVEKSQRQPQQSPLDYDLQLRNNQLDLLLLSKFPAPSPKPTIPPKPSNVSKSPVLSKGSTSTADEGFESDIDTISLVSCENETFSGEKAAPKSVLTETDSANGGSGTESETETEKTNTLTPKNVNSIKEGFEKESFSSKTKETFDLVDCVCYTDVTYPDVLIFVIKNEALVFKFDNLEKLQTFYTNFTTLKAVTNQKAYNTGKNVATKYNLLQRTDQNGVTHIEIKKEHGLDVYGQTNSGPSSIISIDAPDGTVTKNFIEFEGSKSNKTKDVNLRQRTESKLINDLKLLNDLKFNTITNKVGQKKMIVRSSSIENILNIDRKESNLVKDDGGVGLLRKVWNSAEDLLLDSDLPRRPERRRKKKPAPPPPVQKPSQPDKVEDVFRGQFVRVNVNIDNSKDFSDRNRLVVKSNLNEPHPKKLGQNFNILGGKNNFTSFFSKSEPKSGSQVLRYPQENATLNRPQRVPLYEKNNSWTNSVPRVLKKSSRSRSETRMQHQNFQPMAYRYIDTTLEYSYNPATHNNAMFLTATGLKPKPQTPEPLRRKLQTVETSQHHQQRLSYGYNVTSFPKNQDNSIGNRIFGLTPKLKDFSRSEGLKGGNKWGSTSDLTYLMDREKNNLKSSIKSGEGVGKKKNEKKVTFSAYTTVQVV